MFHKPFAEKIGGPQTDQGKYQRSGAKFPRVRPPNLHDSCEKIVEQGWVHHPRRMPAFPAYIGDAGVIGSKVVGPKRMLQNSLRHRDEVKVIHKISAADKWQGGD